MKVVVNQAIYPELGGPSGADFQAALQSGTAHVALCPDCGLKFFYPRPVCPRCVHGNVQLVEHRTPLQVFSFTYVHRVQSPVFDPVSPALMMTVVDGDLRLIVEGHGWSADAPPHIGDSVMLACDKRSDESTVIVAKPA